MLLEGEELDIDTMKKYIDKVSYLSEFFFAVRKRRFRMKILVYNDTKNHFIFMKGEYGK